MDIQHEVIKRNYTVRHIQDFRRSVPHWHQRMELLLVDRGEFSVTIRNKRHFSSAGDLFLIRSAEIHLIQPLCADASMYICTFSPTMLHQLQPTVPLVNLHIPSAALKQAELQNTVFTLLHESWLDAQEKGTYADLVIPSRIQLLYGLLLQHFEPETDTGKAPGKFTDFQKVLTYISENYHESIDLNAIAKQLSYSPSYVSSMFLTFSGVNFKIYLDTIRIREASRLLLDTGLAVSDISSRCGFDNIRTFNNVFRRITGITPSQYRKQN